MGSGYMNENWKWNRDIKCRVFMSLHSYKGIDGICKNNDLIIIFLETFYLSIYIGYIIEGTF